MVLKSLKNATPEMLTEMVQDSLVLANEIQPHGVVFVLKEPLLEIIQVSDNTENFLGIAAQELLNNNLSKIFDKSALETIHNHRKKEQIKSYNPLQITVNLEGKFQVFEGCLSRQREGLILELEPLSKPSSETNLSFYQLFRPCYERIKQGKTLEEVAQKIVGTNCLS